MPRFSGSYRALFLCLVFGTTGIARAQQVEIVSRVHPSQVSDTALGGGGNPSLSGDGRYVVFQSSATHLVAGQKDANETTDVFLRDRVSGNTTLVSRAASSPAVAANAGGSGAVISADGRYVAWIGESTDVTGPAPAEEDIGAKVFLFDRVTGANTLVAFSEYFRENNAEGFEGLAFSADSRYLVFNSDAPDLFAGQADNNFEADAFLYDREARTIRLISHSSASPNAAVGGRATALSADGRIVAVTSPSGDLVPGVPPGSDNTFLYDRVADSFERVAPTSRIWALSADGRFAAFWSSEPILPGQTEGNGNDGADLFLYDRTTRGTVLVSHAQGSATRTGNRRVEAFGRSGMSADGRFLTFVSAATDLAPGASGGWALFVYDRTTGTNALLSRVTDSIFSGFPEDPKISGDGRYIVFTSPLPDLVNGQADGEESDDVFLYDRSAGEMTLVSAAGDSPLTAGNRDSRKPVISATGGVIVYSSVATNLVAGLKDLNEEEDLFVSVEADNAAVTARAPELPSLTPPGNSTARAVSGDGRYVVFESTASGLIATQLDRNDGGADIFLFDAVAKTIVLVSRAAGWTIATGNGKAENPSISADGRYIAYTSLATDLVAGVADTNEGADVFLFDRITGATTLVSRSAAGGGAANRSSESAVLSADGRYVAFDSQATDLIAGLDARSAFNVFLYDRESGAIQLVSRSNAGPRTTGENISLRPALNADGRYVAFVSYAKDLVSGQVDPDPQPDGRTLDLFLHDRATGATTLVTHRPGAPATAAGGVLSTLSSISADGRFLTFSARGDALVSNVPNDDSNVYLYDRTSGINTLLSASEDGYARDPVISADGRYVAFLSDGSDLIPGQIPTEDRDQLFLFDRAAGSLSLVKGTGELGTLVARGHALTPTISADGRYLTFISTLADFIRDEFAGPDVFLYDRVSGALTLVSRTLTSAVTGGGGSFSPLISADGQRIAFSSRSPELAAGDYNGVGLDAFLYSRTATPSGPVSVPPCTLLDTRRAGNRPALRSNVSKVLTAGGACGVPAAAKSVLVKVTALQATGKGNLRFFPGSTTAASSGILRFQKNRTQAADFTLPLGQGKLNILPFVAGNGTVHVIVEVKGYVR